jgi:hypothetical protein
MGALTVKKECILWINYDSADQLRFCDSNYTIQVLCESRQSWQYSVNQVSLIQNSVNSLWPSNFSIIGSEKILWFKLYDSIIAWIKAVFCKSRHYSVNYDCMIKNSANSLGPSNFSECLQFGLIKIPSKNPGSCTLSEAQNAKCSRTS